MFLGDLVHVLEIEGQGKRKSSVNIAGAEKLYTKLKFQTGTCSWNSVEAVG